MRFLVVFAAAAIALSFGSSNFQASARVAGAQYCLSIDVTKDTAEELAQHFDAFARAADLEIDASNPFMRVYYPPGNGIYPTDSATMIVLERMGPFGSILSYTVLKEGAPPDLLDQLKRFVLEEISRGYRTVRCQEIKGFSAPQTYY